MAQQPAVIFIARHGPRLDAADPSWHLSTPTPYDPPITYGGWNQSRVLGTRIATLLHARERSHNRPQSDASGSAPRQQDGEDEQPPKKRRRLKHRVVIHSSPFLRCLQTSTAIAAGMAQYKPAVEVPTNQKRPASASPRLRTAEGSGSPRSLSSIAEPKYDFAHAIARKVMYDQKRYRRCKVRVDAFLGEWLNPQYFEGITAPPPSAMMVATAKGELMENENLQFYRPTITTKPSGDHALWSGSDGSKPGSRASPLDDLSPVEDAMPTSPARSRSNSQNSPISIESGRKSPFRPGSPIQSLTSTLPKQEASTYMPPVPQYAVSPSNRIPQGYVSHARNACTDVDLSWDSSRPPHNWGDGGEYGEEWSQMHKRIRKGINHLVQFYGQRDADDKSEAPIGFEEADGNGGDEEEEDQEDLVVILVTHGAGCNALIGALTGQPVLLDVGMASLTMAVRQDDAPPINVNASQNPSKRRGSVDTGLSSIYEMKLVASTEHLRPGADLKSAAAPVGRSSVTSVSRDAMPRFKERLEPGRSNTNSSLGSIRRPSAASIITISNAPRDTKISNGTDSASSAAASKLSAGLWTPSAGHTPVLRPQTQQQIQRSQAQADKAEQTERAEPNDGMSLDSMNQNAAAFSANSRLTETQANTIANRHDVTNNSSGNSDAGSGDGDSLQPGLTIPPELGRKMSQQGLWGSRPSGAQIERKVREPKRRWTVEQD